ncbi:MAG: hypothetical protein H0U74_04180 [Bradymonadaceae bacterium]|nr:hypothetical protein [Lujinxingiaceae bacterium]
MVANKRSITETIDSSVEVNLEVLGAKLEYLLFKGPPPQPLTMALVAKAISGVLIESYEGVEVLDREVATEVGQDRVKRATRDGYVGRLRQRLISLRGNIEADFGSAAVAHLGMAGETPSNPDQLITHSRNVVEQMAAGLSDFPPTLPDLEPLDLAARAEGITRDVAHLERAIAALNKDLRETQDAQNKRNLATERWNKHYSPVASIVENLFRLAEMPAHAERVRPTNRRRAGLPEPVDAENALGVDQVYEEEVVLDV